MADPGHPLSCPLVEVRLEAEVCAGRPCAQRHRCHGRDPRRRQSTRKSRAHASSPFPGAGSVAGTAGHCGTRRGLRGAESAAASRTCSATGTGAPITRGSAYDGGGTTWSGLVLQPQIVMFMAAVTERFSWPVSTSDGRSRARASIREARPRQCSYSAARSSRRIVSSALCAFEQPGLHCVGTGGAALWDAGRVTLEDLVRLRRARDLMDRDYAKPLDVPALARAALMSPGHFSRSLPRRLRGDAVQLPDDAPDRAGQGAAAAG